MIWEIILFIYLVIGAVVASCNFIGDKGNDEIQEGDTIFFLFALCIFWPANVLNNIILFFNQHEGGE